MMSTGSSHSASRIEKIREALSQLEDIRLPEKYEPCSSSSHEEILERYETARNNYLQRRILREYLNRVETFDGKGFEKPEQPSKEELEMLEEKRNQIQRDVAAMSQHLQSSVQQIRHKYHTLQTRRDELENMIREAEKSDTLMEEDNMEYQEVKDDELKAQEDKLAELQVRRAELEAKLEHAQKQTLKMQKDNVEAKKKLFQKYGVTDLSQASIEQMEKENAEIKRQIAEREEIDAFYNGLRDIVEELSGISIVGVSQENGNLVLKTQLLRQYDVRVVLEPNHKGTLKVSAASFTSDTVINGPLLDDGTVSVQLTIPSLDDLVLVVKTSQFPAGDDLRFLLTEALGRCSATQSRVEELATLQDEVVTKIGTRYHDTNSYGGEDQEVLCSLNEQITLVLRMTPDCPLVEGSVYIDQMVGMGGWKKSLVDDIKERINAEKFASPVQLIRAVRAEIKRLENEGVELPKTPTLPSKKK